MTYGPTDRAVKVTHLLTPDDVERIVDALAVDGLRVCDKDVWWSPVNDYRIKAALCGGTESDYR